MISKDRYVKCVDTLSKFYRYSDKVYNKTDGAIDINEMTPVADLANTFMELLEYLTHEEINDSYGSNLQYYLFETDSGKTDVEVIGENGKKIKLKNAKDLWNNFIVKEHPEVEDKEYV